jgi:hypothetical protein
MSTYLFIYFLARQRRPVMLSTDHFSVDGTLIRSLGVDEERQAEGWSSRDRVRRRPEAVVKRELLRGHVDRLPWREAHQ